MSYIGLLRQYPRYIGYGMAYFFFSSLGQTFMFALFIPDIERTFNLTSTQSGTFYGVTSLISALLLFYTGTFVDKWNLRIFGGLVAFVLGCAAFLMAWSPHLYVMLFAMFLLRHFGQGLMVQTASTAIARYFTQNRGKAISLKSLGISFAEGLLPTVVAFLIAAFGWRMGMVSLGAACLLVCIPMNLFMLKAGEKFTQPLQDDAPIEVSVATSTTELGGHIPAAAELNWGRRQLLSHSYFWLVLLHIIAPAFVLTGLFFQQVVVAEAQGWSLPLLASGFVAFGIVRTFGTLAIGPVVDTFSGKQLLAYTNIPLALGMGCLLLNDAPYLVYPYMALMGFSVGIGGTVTNAMWAEVYGRKHLGAIKSMIMALAVLSTAAAPPLVGWLIDHNHAADDIVLGGVVFVVVSGFLAWFAKPPKSA